MFLHLLSLIDNYFVSGGLPQGTTATQEQRAEEERNKKVLQWVRKVAAQVCDAACQLAPCGSVTAHASLRRFVQSSSARPSRSCSACSMGLLRQCALT